MSELRPALEILRDQLAPRPGSFERFLAFQRRRRRNQRAAASFLAFVMAVAGLALAVRAFRLAEEPPGAAAPRGGFAFSSYRYGRLDIFLMNSDGIGVVRLTDDPAEDHQPTWSPNGTKIAFSSTRSKGPPHTRSDIFIMEADGSGIRRLTFGLSSAGAPAWSPEGERIAFAGCCEPASDIHNGWDIYVINADGSGLTRLTTGPTFDYHPAWSPEGRQMAFSRDRDGTGPTSASHGIYVMNADGSGLRQLTEGEGAQPSWSPDGDRIAFQGRRDGPGIYVMNADGGDVTRLTNDPRGTGDPAWSPDGAEIAFTSYRVNGEGDVFVMNADGGSQTRLTDNPAGDYDPAWHPLASGSLPSPTEPQLGPSPQPSPTESLAPARHEPFVPRTYREDGKVIMPVTFPDGTSAEILYPADLELAGMGVQPDVSYLSLEDPPPRYPVMFVHGPLGPGFLAGDGPVRTFRTPSGLMAELWEASESSVILDLQTRWLVLRLPSWTLLAAVTTRLGPEEVGPALDARETSGGFPVIEATSPIGLSHESGEGEGPSISIGDSDSGPRMVRVDERFRLVILWVAPCRGVGELSPSGEYASRCLGGSLAANIYGNRSFVEAVYEGLEARNVRGPP